MAKKITQWEDKPKHVGYPENDMPYHLMVEWLTEGKTAEEAQRIIAEFEESHTYLMIAEYGAWSPVFPMLIKIYEEEQKSGLYGFVKGLKTYDPNLLGIL